MRLFRKRIRDKPREKRASELDDFIKGADADMGGVASGVHVDEDRAMQTSAVYPCVRLIADTIASLPLHLITHNGDAKEKATHHPLYACLYASPNNEMTSFSFREVMMTSLLLYGNAYARIIRKGKHVTQLWYLSPESMTVERDSKTGKLTYTYSDDGGQTITYNANQIFHIKGISNDGVTGMSPIAQARESIGLALATEEYGARFFGNGARPGGVLKHPGIVKDPDKLRNSWNSVYQGPRNSHKIAVLEEGMKYHTIGIAPADLQFLETRKYN